MVYVDEAVVTHEAVKHMPRDTIAAGRFLTRRRAEVIEAEPAP